MGCATREREERGARASFPSRSLPNSCWFKSRTYVVSIQFDGSKSDVLHRCSADSTVAAL